MFISKKRHRREMEQSAESLRRITDEVLGCASEGLCRIDENDLILAPVSRAFASLFGRRDLAQTSFSKLLQSVLPHDTVAAAIEHMKLLRKSENVAEIRAGNPLAHVSARLTSAAGTIAMRHLRFDFRRSNQIESGRTLIVVISDVTDTTQLTRELTDIRDYSETQSMCLSGIVRLGAERFAAFLQRTDAAMTTINLVLKKPARETSAFQSKLQEILSEIQRIALDAQSSSLVGIENQARNVEKSLDELCKRDALSGTDFLPLAVKLDQLSAQLSLMRSLTANSPASRAVAGPINAAVAAGVSDASATAGPGANGAAGAAAENSGSGGLACATFDDGEPRVTENGTQIMSAPRFDLMTGEPAPPAVSRILSAGSLENTLRELTEHIAQDTQRSVTLDCAGLDLVPQRYQGIIKNISIQLIRNAVRHGIESAQERVAAGKLAFGKLSLNFRRLDDGSFEYCFEDDGRGLNAAGMRESAVAHGLMTQDAAQRLPDRQAIKLLFKIGVTTEQDAPVTSQRGLGMAMVRRLVSESNGKIALATIPGEQTRFKISLPAISQDQSQVA